MNLMDNLNNYLYILFGAFTLADDSSGSFFRFSRRMPGWRPSIPSGWPWRSPYL